MFTIAGRPAAKVSNSLFGELVASTGTSLKNVRQALEAAASSATSSLPAAGPGKLTFGRRRALQLGAPLAVAHQHELHVLEQAARPPAPAPRSLASPIVPK